MNISKLLGVYMESLLLYQVIVLIMAVIAVILFAIRYKNGKTNLSTFLVSIIFWLIIVAIGIFPESTTYVAQIVGFRRGLDLVFVLAIVFLGYLLIKINMRLDSENEELTKLIRKIAMDNEESLDDDKEDD